MEHHRKTLEDYNEGDLNIWEIDELIEEIRSDEEFVNTSHTISIIDIELKLNIKTKIIVVALLYLNNTCQ